MIFLVCFPFVCLFVCVCFFVITNRYWFHHPAYWKRSIKNVHEMNFTIGLYGPRSSSIILFRTQVQSYVVHACKSLHIGTAWLFVDLSGCPKGSKCPKVSQRVEVSKRVKGSKRVQGDQRYDRVHIVVFKIVKKKIKSNFFSWTPCR